MKIEKSPAKEPQKVNAQSLKNLRLLHRQYVFQLKSIKYKTRETEEIYKQIHQVHSIIMLHKEIEDYNRLAVNRCKFRLTDTCEAVFNNNFKHYQLHGNCCSECSAFAYNSTLYR